MLCGRVVKAAPCGLKLEYPWALTQEHHMQACIKAAIYERPSRRSLQSVAAYAWGQSVG